MNHYDTLKLTQDAPQALIKAAYRYLSQVHHPDMNPGDAGAHHAMAAINAAYEVLSDESKRRTYDALRRTTNAFREPNPAGSPQAADSVRTTDPTRRGASFTVDLDKLKPLGTGFDPWTGRLKNRTSIAMSEHKLGSLESRASAWKTQLTKPSVSGVHVLLVLGLIFTLIVLFFQTTKRVDSPDVPKAFNVIQEVPQVPKLVPYFGPVNPIGGFDSAGAKAAGYSDREIADYLAQKQEPAVGARSAPRATYVRLRNDFHGDAWPLSASYLYDSANRNHAEGYSSIVVDNSGNSTDVYVGLTHGGANNPMRLREAFIPAHGRFTMYTLAPGHYDLRFLILDTGHMARTEAFDLTETSSADTVRYSNMRLTLFKVPDGNAKIYDLTEDEF